MGRNYLSIRTFSNFNGGTIGVLRWPKFKHGCDYLFIPGLKLIHVRNRGPMRASCICCDLTNNITMGQVSLNVVKPVHWYNLQAGVEMCWRKLSECVCLLDGGVEGGGWGWVVGVELGVHFGTCMLHVLTSRKPGALFTKKTSPYKYSHYKPKPVIRPY